MRPENQEHGEFPIYKIVVDDPIEGRIGLITFMSPAEIEMIGGLPSSVIVGREHHDSDTLEPINFARNKAFVDFMHDTIRRTVPRIGEFQDAARCLQDGWLDILDERSTRRGFPLVPEDVIGRFEVEAGRLDASRYEPNPSHWILSERGMTTPHPRLVEAILQAMRSQEYSEAV